MVKTPFLLLCGILLNINICTGQNHALITPYVSFLNDQKQSAKDYVFELFKTHDIVIICERDHPEFTQYDLFLDIIRDKRFINNVGNVFTEIGLSTLNPGLNTFLHTKDLSLTQQQEQILNFQRNAGFGPYWDPFSYSYFLQNLYNLNSGLSKKDAVNVYPSDIPLNWQKADSTNYESIVRPLLKYRDSIIAAQIIYQFDKLSSTNVRHKKALVIINYRHAFNRNLITPDGNQVNNVAAYLFKRYGNRTANVLLNSLGYDLKNNRPLLQQGKWDAAFAATGNKTVGFNLMNTPFGKDSFDLWVHKNTGLIYQDVFTGYIFYQPIEAHKLVVGVPGLLDSVYLDEFFRRYKLSAVFLPNLKHFTQEEIAGLKRNPQDIERDVNRKREMQYQNIDSLLQARNQWLK